MKKKIILTLWAAGFLIFVFLFSTETACAHSIQLKSFESSLLSGEGFWEVNLPPSAKKAWQSTVQVRCIQIQMCETEKIKKKVKVGTGFIVDLDPERKKAFIVTNNHCIKRQKNLFYQYEVRIPLKSKKESKKEKYFLTRKVSIVMANPDKDLVYLSVQYPHNPHPTAAHLKAIDNDGYSSGDVISIGFPHLPLRQEKNWNVSRPKNYKKIIKRYSRGKLLAKGLSRDQVHILAHNADMLPGSCGGPLVDEEGNVVGINSLVVHPDDKSVDDASFYDYCPGAPNHFYVAISSSEVLKDIELIKKNKLW
jgi:V8-like Glu-specific endopeptidase